MLNITNGTTSTNKGALLPPSNQMPPIDPVAIADACGMSLNIAIAAAKPGPKPLPIKLVERRPRGTNSRAVYYLKRPGQQAYSTNMYVDEVKDPDALLQLIAMQDRAATMGRVNPAGVEIDHVLRFWIGANRPAVAPNGRASRKKQNEIKRYRDSVAKLKLLRLFWHGGKTLSDLDQETCRLYISWRMGLVDKVEGFAQEACPHVCGSLSTVHGDLILLHQALVAYRAKHILPWIPTLYVPPKVGKRIVWLTRDQVARIVWAIRGRIWDASTGTWMVEIHVDPDTGEERRRYVLRSLTERNIRKILLRFLLIGVYTGCRHSVLKDLRWTPDAEHGHFDLDDGIIHRAGFGIDPKEGKPRKSSYVTRRLLVWLRRWYEGDQELGTDRVIHKRDGTGYRAPLDELWRTVVADAGLGADITPHVMRHTCATWLKLSRVDVQTAADLIGMHPKTLTNVYGQWSIEGSRWAAEALDDPAHLKALGSKVKAAGKQGSSSADPRPQIPRRKLRPMSAETRRKLSLAMTGVWRCRRSAPSQP